MTKLGSAHAVDITACEIYLFLMRVTPVHLRVQCFVWEVMDLPVWEVMGLPMGLPVWEVMGLPVWEVMGLPGCSYLTMRSTMALIVLNFHFYEHV